MIHSQQNIKFIRHNEFVVNILEGAISGKKATGRPRLQYFKASHQKHELTVTQQRKEWLVKISDGKLPTHQKTEG
jgi:hypothetical protein